MDNTCVCCGGDALTEEKEGDENGNQVGRNRYESRDAGDRRRKADRERQAGRGGSASRAPREIRAGSGQKECSDMWQYVIPAISAIVVAALTSGGLWALVARRSDKNDAVRKMLVGQYFTEVS